MKNVKIYGILWNDELWHDSLQWLHVNDNMIKFDWIGDQYVPNTLIKYV